MIYLVIYLILILLLFFLSKRKKEDIELKHCKYLKSFYPAFLPIGKKVTNYLQADNRLFLLYPNYKADRILSLHISLKMSIFCLMLFLPVVVLITKASNMFLLFSFILCFFSTLAVDMDVKKEYETMKEGVLEDFSLFLTKLTLYISSGMTLYQAFVLEDYDLKEGVFKRYLEEARRNLSLRSDPQEAFLNLSIHLPLAQINGFSALMISAFKNTEAQLAETLKSYTGEIWLEKRNEIKKRAEKAAAKSILALALGLLGLLLVLIAPAVLMLSDI